MKKRLLSLFSVFFLLLTLFSINANNIYAKENEGIQPRLPLCTACFQGTISVRRVKVTSYPSGETVKCIHGHSYGTDNVIIDVYKETHRCSHCGILLEETQRVKTYVCHGYD